MAQCVCMVALISKYLFFNYIQLDVSHEIETETACKVVQLPKTEIIKWSVFGFRRCHFGVQFCISFITNILREQNSADQIIMLKLDWKKNEKGETYPPECIRPILLDLIQAWYKKLQCYLKMQNIKEYIYSERCQTICLVFCCFESTFKNYIQRTTQQGKTRENNFSQRVNACSRDRLQRVATQQGSRSKRVESAMHAKKARLECNSVMETSNEAFFFSTEF